MSIVNLEELKEIMDNDMELIQECFAEFLIDYPGLIDEIKSAVDAKNFDDIDNSAHKLKGTLRYLAAESAANAAGIVEKAGKQQDPEGLTDKIAALEVECRKVILFIDEFPT